MGEGRFDFDCAPLRHVVPAWCGDGIEAKRGEPSSRNSLPRLRYDTTQSAPDHRDIGALSRRLLARVRVVPAGGARSQGLELWRHSDRNTSPSTATAR